VSSNKYQQIFISKLRNKGLEVTEERLKILEEVFSRHDHFDVETIVNKMNEERTGVSRATVYRTIELLLEFGFINKLVLGNGSVRYEHIIGHSNHEHLICEVCGTILEVRIPELEKIQEEIALQNYFVPSRRTFNVYGVCRKCREKMEKKRK
jgi:Fur family ferric uptake transcriptional regulator